jgi:hypothetical protein
MHRNILKLWLFGSLVCISGCAARLQTPPPQSFFSKWLMLEEPGIKRFGVTDMWDGTQADSGCYVADTVVVDTLNQQRFEIGSTSMDASFGATLLDRIGLQVARHQAQAWTLTASGSMIVSSRGLRPNLGASCQTKREGLPRYPVIASMIGFDSMTFGGTDDAGRRLDLTKIDLSNVLRVTGGTASAADSLLHFTFLERAWVGQHLWMLKPRPSRQCEWTASLNVTGGCPHDEEAFPFAVGIRQLEDGRYRITSRNKKIPNAVAETDTADLGEFATIGLLPGTTGTRGEWYSVGVVRLIRPSEVRVKLVLHDYDVLRFENEADRGRLKKALRQ